MNIIQCISTFVTGASLTSSKILFEKFLYLEAGHSLSKIIFPFFDT